MPMITVFGSEGRRGKLLREQAGDSCIGRYDITLPSSKSDCPLPDEVEVIIDFSLPQAWKDLDKLLERTDAALVSGTTGLGDDELKLLDKWSRERPVFYSSNMSRGIFVLGKLLEDAAAMLGDSFDIELIETHHSGKIDSPSGTALLLAEIWQEKCGGENRCGRHNSEGPRKKEMIGIHSVRGGDIVGEHDIHLLGTGERLLLSHTATSRSTFAIGALKAAEWLIGKPPGLYSMTDMMAGKTTE